MSRYTTEQGERVAKAVQKQFISIEVDRTAEDGSIISNEDRFLRKERIRAIWNQWMYDAEYSHEEILYFLSLIREFATEMPEYFQEMNKLKSYKLSLSKDTEEEQITKGVINLILRT